MKIKTIFTILILQTAITISLHAEDGTSGPVEPQKNSPHVGFGLSSGPSQVEVPFQYICAGRVKAGPGTGKSVIVEGGLSQGCDKVQQEVLDKLKRDTGIGKGLENRTLEYRQPLKIKKEDVDFFCRREEFKTDACQ